MRPLIAFIILAVASAPTGARSDDPQLREQAAGALRKATEFFTGRVATEGGYLWRYSEDLTRREGEGKATDTMVWVQPPGTPAVGMALLKAYEDTLDPYYLNAAKQAGYCLVRGQLRSGGWDYRIYFDPKERSRYAYRVDAQSEGKQYRNTTTLDDDNTQSALRLLMRLDKALGFRDAAIHEAAEYALARLLEAQYPIGAWPQRFAEPADAEKAPVRKAGYPDSWSRTFPGVDYQGFYTFNDNSLADMIATMFEAAEVYGDARYRAAAERAGDFILLAQMPDPQPAWAQQYDLEMRPAWARKFEPPSVTGGESQGVLRTLMELYRNTGDKKYLQPIPKAIAYLRRSQLPDGRLARFYELKTNRPLYFTMNYQLTYSDADMPTHYAFIVSNGIDGIQQQYRELLDLAPDQLQPQRPRAARKPSNSQIARVKQISADLDDQGRWLEEGRLQEHGEDDPTRRVIDCRTFITNVGHLSSYLATSPE